MKVFGFIVRFSDNSSFCREIKICLPACASTQFHAKKCAFRHVLSCSLIRRNVPVSMRNLPISMCFKAVSCEEICQSACASMLFHQHCSYSLSLKGPAHEILVLTTYIQKPPLSADTGVSRLGWGQRSKFWSEPSSTSYFMPEATLRL